MEGLTEGRIVHYVLPDGRHAGEHRPAIVVKVWPGAGSIQLQVFTDGGDTPPLSNDGLPQVMWKTSVVHNEAEKRPGTWHWPERV